MKKEIKHIHTDLALKAGSGNQRAQFELYGLYSKAMYNTAVRILNDGMLAEEKMQDAFMTAFSKMDQWAQKATFGAWLKRIVVNECLDHLAKKKLETVSIHENLHIEEADDQVDEKVMRYDVSAIKKAVQKLPDGYRVVVNLYLFEGFDHEEISEVLKISSATSRSQFMRGKKKLIQILETEQYAR